MFTCFFFVNVLFAKEAAWKLSTKVSLCLPGGKYTYLISHRITAQFEIIGRGMCHTPLPMRDQNIQGFKTTHTNHLLEK